MSVPDDRGNPQDDADVREELRRFQDAERDAGLDEGIVTDELEDASEPERDR